MRKEERLSELHNDLSAALTKVREIDWRYPDSGMAQRQQTYFPCRGSVYGKKAGICTNQMTTQQLIHQNTEQIRRSEELPRECEQGWIAEIVFWLRLFRLELMRNKPQRPKPASGQLAKWLALSPSFRRVGAIALLACLVGCEAKVNVKSAPATVSTISDTFRKYTDDQEHYFRMGVSYVLASHGQMPATVSNIGQIEDWQWWNFTNRNENAVHWKP